MKNIIIIVSTLLISLTSCNQNQATQNQPDTLHNNNSVELLTYSELNKKTKEELRLIRNEVYARKGYPFTSQDLVDHFTQQKWYHPSPDSVNVKLSKVEDLYVHLIKELEENLRTTVKDSVGISQ